MSISSGPPGSFNRRERTPYLVRIQSWAGKSVSSGRVATALVCCAIPPWKAQTHLTGFVAGLLRNWWVTLEVIIQVFHFGRSSLQTDLGQETSSAFITPTLLGSPTYAWPSHLRRTPTLATAFKPRPGKGDSYSFPVPPCTPRPL